MSTATAVAASFPGTDPPTSATGGLPVTAASVTGAWATCPHCRRDLYPRTARRTVDGWVCSNARMCGYVAKSVVLGDEIAWLVSFGWRPEQIARRLGVTVSCVEKRLARERVAA